MNVLEKIVADKRVEIVQREKQFPVEAFINELTPSDRNFKQALINDRKNKGAAFIFECKKASPSKGLIRPVFDLDEICQAYGKYASCVSVLSDEKYFQGEFERLPQVRSKLPQPVLCKDFFVHPYQVHLARHFGANAILLMLSVLDDETYASLHSLAKSYGMDVLTEVSNEEEMHRAVALKCDILGINNRNLRDLSTDLKQTPILVALFRELASEEQQNDTVLISESGIYHYDQIKKLNAFADGYLVGSSLMAQTDLELACRELVHGQHKVCGLTSSKDAKMVAENGASYGGLIFVKKSRRAVDKTTAKTIIEQTKATTRLKFAAVVQNEPIDSLLKLLCDVPVDAVQLHGEEDQQYVSELKAQLIEADLSTEIWQVVSIGLDGRLPERWPVCDKILLDTIAPDGVKGGTGLSFDWQHLSQLDLNLPPMILAGGINPVNVGLTKRLPVIGVDLNSGVESKPGIKDETLVKQCFSTLFE